MIESTPIRGAAVVLPVHILLQLLSIWTVAYAQNWVKSCTRLFTVDLSLMELCC